VFLLKIDDCSGQDINLILWIPKVRYCIDKTPSMVLKCWPRLVQAKFSHRSSVRSILITSSRLRPNIVTCWFFFLTVRCFVCYRPLFFFLRIFIDYNSQRALLHDPLHSSLFVEWILLFTQYCLPCKQYFFSVLKYSTHISWQFGHIACYLCMLGTYINIIWENVSIFNDYHNSVFANRRDDLTVVWVEVIFWS